MSSPSEGSPAKLNTSGGLALQVDFLWSKFRNNVSEKNGDQLEPLYVQHFRPKKPQLRFESVTHGRDIGTGTINNVAINAECKLHGHDIALKPLKRFKTEYSYLSHALTTAEHPDPVPVTWVANANLKTWNFICLDANQLAIAKFSANIWALKEVGNFYFEKPGEEISEEVRDEVVCTGLTVFYVMVMRLNNPLNLLGATFGKKGTLNDDEEEADNAKDADKQHKD